MASWVNDSAHSRLGFIVRHLGVADITGRFNDFTLSLTAVADDFSDVRIDGKIQVASICTSIDARDNHLRSKDFFNVDTFSEITFTTTASTLSSSNGTIEGDITILGITKHISLNIEYGGKAINPMSNIETIGFKITGTLKRSDFGLGSAFPTALISDSIKLVGDMEFTKA